jgi:hypothetical protein
MNTLKKCAVYVEAGFNTLNTINFLMSQNRCLGWHLANNVNIMLFEILGTSIFCCALFKFYSAWNTQGQTLEKLDCPKHATLFVKLQDVKCFFCSFSYSLGYVEVKKFSKNFFVKIFHSCVPLVIFFLHFWCEKILVITQGFI